MHKNHFFEFAGALTVEIEFFLTDQEAQDLLAFLQQHRIRLFYAQVSALYGVINPDRADPPTFERNG